jgi:hypothetical protein
VALVSTGCWYLSDSLANHPYSRAWLVYWEASIHLASFVITGLLVAGIRARLEHERKLTVELRTALDQVRTLEGLIPVCSYCRRMRDDAGYWSRFEAYLASRTDATFTHGICPDCYEQSVFEDRGSGESGTGEDR